MAVLAWVGLGADALSSSCFGPEEAFLALGNHTHFGLYLAAATALTVFVIGVAYNQVIELFPSGGGGYKVATSLIGPYSGLVSGAALIVDYMLTIATSMASGVDAVFSLLPLDAQPFKLATAVGLVFLLMVLNLRGMKESIQVLLPIFLGFFVIHAVLIVYGVLFHSGALPALVPDTLKETRELSRDMGWFFALSLFLRASAAGDLHRRATSTEAPAPAEEGRGAAGSEAPSRVKRIISDGCTWASRLLLTCCPPARTSRRTSFFTTRDRR